MTKKRPFLTIAAILSATLILGMILGGMIVGAIIRDRVENLRALRTADGFAYHVGKIIGPVPDGQQATLDKILKDTGQQVEQVIARRRTEYMLILDDMERELEPVITRAQLEKLRAVRRQLRAQADGN